MGIKNSRLELLGSVLNPLVAPMAEIFMSGLQFCVGQSMKTIISYPLIRNENGDIELYLSEEALLADVEVVDVDNYEYQVFDASGKSLCLVSEASTRRFLGVVLPSRGPVLRLGDTHANDPNAVRTFLIRWLQTRGTKMNAEATQSLSNLAATCLGVLRKETAVE